MFIFTGPESTGKTFLSKSLMERFNLPYLPEESRIYLDKNGLNYQEEDLEKIAKIHTQKELQLANQGDYIILDTDLLTLYIWSMEKYGNVSAYINAQLSAYSKNRFYFLCKPDIPWKSDPQRENPLDRNRLFKIYEKLLLKLNLQFIIIEGSFDQRLEKVTTVFHKSYSAKL